MMQAPPVGTAPGSSRTAARPSPSNDTRLDFRAGLWRLADPKISLASMASIFLGACLAAREGAMAWGWLALTVLGIFLLEVAKNASGELADFDSGADPAVRPEDRSPFSGGKRVLVDGLLTRRQTAWISGVGYVLGIAAGLLIVTLREPDVFWLGVVGVACAYAYSFLCYLGLGELLVAACYGPMIGGGTYLVQRGDCPEPVLLTLVPLGLMIGAFLWINEFPDHDADLGAGKRNLVVRLGRDRAAAVFPILIAGAGVMTLLLPFAGLPRASSLGVAGVIPGMMAARILLRHPGHTARLIPAQVLTLGAFLMTAVGTGMGILLGPA